MAIQLMKLRHVPEDELVEVLQLLDEHEVDYYQTTAGLFGISLPALWMRDESRADEVRALLEGYAQQRQARAREARDLQIALHGKRGIVDIFRDSPLKFIARVLLIAFFLWLSVTPFIQ